MFSRGGSLLPSIYADARYIDAVIVSKAELAGVGLLMTATATVGAASSQEKKKVHLIDGGFVDTTGIVALLQRQTSKIMVFCNNNDELKPASLTTLSHPSCRASARGHG